MSISTYVFDDTKQVAAAAGEALIAAAKNSRKRPVGLATGKTMKPVYDYLVERESEENDLFSGTIFSQLDEVLGSTTFADDVVTNLVLKLRSRPAAFWMIDGKAEHPESEAIEHSSHIHLAGGLAVQLLGIGVNGHIGFNEPGSSDTSRCRVIELTKSTVLRNGYVKGTKAITLGVSDILSAGKLIVVATGAAKAQAVGAMIKGPITPDCPASLLRKHPDVRLFLDKKAASEIE